MTTPTIASCIAAAALALAGCASVPPESARLAAGVGRQIVALEKNHLFYVAGYYDRLEAQASDAVDRQYAPAIVETALQGETGQALRRRLAANSAGNGDDAAWLAHFLGLVRARVEERRKADTAPIAQAKQAALARTRAAYAQVLQGNDAVAAYLGSLVRLHDAQSAMFDLPDALPAADPAQPATPTE